MMTPKKNTGLYRGATLNPAFSELKSDNNCHFSAFNDLNLFPLPVLL